MSDVQEAAVEAAEPLEAAVEEQDTSPEAAEKVALEAKANLSKAEVKKLRKLQIKVDGKTEDLDLPFELEDKPEYIEWMKKNIQMSRGAEKRMAEKANLEKEVEQFINELRQNPRKVLSNKNLGVDLKQLAAQILEEEIENSKKSPDQIEKEQLQARLRELEDERKTEKDDLSKKERERLEIQEFERYDMLMTQALEKSDLPKTPYIVKKMADYMLLGIDNGENVSPEDVIPLVREEMQNDLKEMFASMPDEVIESIIGKDVFSRVRKKNVAKAKSAAPQTLKSQIKDSGLKEANRSASAAPKKDYKSFFGI